MSDVILKVENLSKQYRLGTVGTGTISHDLNRWWHKIRGKEDPYLKIGETNDRSKKGESDYAWALRDINFEVKSGEVLGIIGKNGAGKSTLLKILSRVTSPTTGEIKTKGRIASLLEVGTGFHPELTGRENIYLNGAILGMTKAEINYKEQEIIEFSGCERYIDTPVKRYSSGMRVRLAFAVAAHLEPDILVVDEVLAVGDAEFQKKAIGKMQDISKGEGRTVLFVSHDMAAIQNLCSNLIVLDSGQLEFIGEVNKGIFDYQNNNQQQSSNYRDNKISVSFFNSEMSSISALSVGEKLIIRCCLYFGNLENLSISVGFFDSIGSFMFSCRSEIINVTFNGDKKDALLEIPKWPLSKGVYSYNIAIHYKGTIIHNIKGAGNIFIENGDFYGSGKLPGHEKAFYIDYKWL